MEQKPDNLMATIIISPNCSLSVIREAPKNLSEDEDDIFYVVSQDPGIFKRS